MTRAGQNKEKGKIPAIKQYEGRRILPPTLRPFNSLSPLQGLLIHGKRAPNVLTSSCQGRGGLWILGPALTGNGRARNIGEPETARLIIKADLSPIAGISIICYLI